MAALVLEQLWTPPALEIELLLPTDEVVTIAQIAPASVAAVIGPPGSIGNSYTHTQSLASSTWTINHNLGRRPDFSLFTDGGIQFTAGITHPTINQSIVETGIPMTGTAEGR